jgi:hypothetical protein
VLPVCPVVGEATLAEMLCLARSLPSGCLVEVGVYQGGSAWHLTQLALEQQRDIYLYDTFTGIPYAEAIDSHHPGDFADTSYHAVCQLLPTARVIQGIFPDSAIEMPPVAFAHLDCDQYRAVKESAEYLMTRMTPRGVIWFDDAPCLAGAKKAAEQLFGARLRTSLTGKYFVEF